MVLTFLATDISGGDAMLDIPHVFRTDGIIEILSIGGWLLAYLVQGFVFAPRFLHFPNCMTMGDVMKTLYKGPSQILTGILATATAICIAGMEVTVLGVLTEVLLGVDFIWGVALGGGLLVLYTVNGGMKAVTYTDILQFLIFIAIVPILASDALRFAGGKEAVMAALSASQRTILHHPKLGEYGAIFLSLAVFQFGIIDPALVQRMLLSPSKKDIREQFLYMSMLLFCVLLCLMTLGLVSNALFPGDNTSLVIPQMIQYILPIGLRGFAYAGLFAITMATFDSYLHAAGLTLVHDVIAPICERNNQKIDELMVTRCVTLLIGCVVILLGALHVKDLYSFVATSYIFIGPLLAFPLFAGVLGLKPDQCAFYTAFIGTIIALALCKCLLPTHYAYWTGIIGVCVNGMLFLGIHAIRNKGFSIVKYEDTETQDVDLA